MPAAAVFLIAILAVVSAQNKGYGNDIVVNIGQSNADNAGAGYGVRKDVGQAKTPSPPNRPSLSPTPETVPGKAPAAQQTLCSADGATIAVDSGVVQGHLKAGAKLGACSPTPAPTPPPSPQPQPSPPPSPEPPSDPPTPKPTTKQPKKILPKKWLAPATRAPETVRVAVCLPIVFTSILIPADSLGQFLAKGATVGNCTAASAPPTSPPPPAPMSSPPAPASPVTVQQAAECTPPPPPRYSGPLQSLRTAARPLGPVPPGLLAPQPAMARVALP